MRIKYRCPVNGTVRLKFVFPVQSDFFTYEFEADIDGRLTYVSATAPVPDKSMWPTVRPSLMPGIAADINFSSPFHPVLRNDMRAAEGMLSLLGINSIDVDGAEELWLPDSEEEKRELELNYVKRSVQEKPVRSWPFLEFDLVARAFLAAAKGRDIETALSFYRKGRIDVMESRYIEAVYDFLFMIESLYADGKFKTDQVQDKYLRSEELQLRIADTLVEPVLHANIRSDSRIAGAFQRDYMGKNPIDITAHIVALRGFLHHHTASRPGIWHPDDHVRFGADAYFLQHLCCATGFALVGPIWFAQEYIDSYTAQAAQAHSDGHFTEFPS